MVDYSLTLPGFYRQTDSTTEHEEEGEDEDDDDDDADEEDRGVGGKRGKLVDGKIGSKKRIGVG